MEYIVVAWVVERLAILAAIDAIVAIAIELVAAAETLADRKIENCS
jgi:hypothetical protein